MEESNESKKKKFEEYVSSVFSLWFALKIVLGNSVCGKDTPLYVEDMKLDVLDMFSFPLASESDLHTHFCPFSQFFF